MLDRAYQPITNNPQALHIGIGAVSLNGDSLGNLLDASLDVTPTLKEKYVGYPAQRMEVFTESMQAILQFTTDELGSASVFSLIEELFNKTNAESPSLYDAVLDMPILGQAGVALAGKTQLLPELSFKLGDDWNSVTFKCEFLGTSAQTLIAYSQGTTGTVCTKNTDNLSIGKPRVELSNVSIGAIQSVEFKLSSQLKRVTVNNPSVTKAQVVIQHNLEISLEAEEEFQIPESTVPVRIIAGLVNGEAVIFNIPVCYISEQVSIATKNDWTAKKYRLLPVVVENTDRIITIERGAKLI